MPEHEPISLLPERLDLPRGRAALPKSQVVAQQRARIMQGAIDEIAEVGYAASTVAGIIRRARVSRTTFYRMFADKVAAFEAAHLVASHRLHRVIGSNAGSHPQAFWRERVHSGVRTYLRNLENAPAFAYCFLVDIWGAGDLLLQRRDDALARHGQALRVLAERASAAGEPVRVPTLLEAIAVVGAADEMTSRAVRGAGRGHRVDLSPLEAPIVQVQLSILR